MGNEGKTEHMFRCKECHATEFNLVINPDFKGEVEISTNEHQEVIVRAGGQEFIADLMFMNQFGVCSECGSIKNWEYYFPKKLTSAGC